MYMNCICAQAIANCGWQVLRQFLMVHLLIKSNASLPLLYFLSALICVHPRLIKIIS